MSLPPDQVLLPAEQASPTRHPTEQAPPDEHQVDDRQGSYVPFTRRTTRRGTPFQYDDFSHSEPPNAPVIPSNALTISSQKIPKLNDKNYKTWCRNIEFVL